MFETDDNTCLAIDISLLAVLVALHVTKKNKNLELVVLALLFSHLIMTTELFSKVEDETDEEVEGEPSEIDPVGAVRAVSVIDEARAANETRASLGAVGDNQESDNQESGSSPKPQSVSDGEFDRMNTTQKPKTNADLAKSRTSFYENLFPTK